MSEPTPGETDQPRHFPPARFEHLVLSLRAQVEVALGLLYFGPEEERPEPDLESARHALDLLGILQGKTQGNLTLEEKRMLENSLTELRFRYVQVAEEQKSRPPKAAEATSSETT